MAIVNDTYQAAENVPLHVTAADGVLANDSEPNGPLEMTDPFDRIDTDQGGAIVFRDDGSFSYVPKAGFSGTDTLTFQVQDQLGTPFSETVTINVSATATQPQLSMADASLTGVTTVGSDQTVTISGTINQSQVEAIVPLTNGGFAIGVVGVLDATPDDEHNVYYQVYGSNGAPVTGLVELPSENPVTNVALASLPTGGFIVAWGPEPGLKVDVQPNRFEILDNAGNVVVGPTELGDATTIAGQPSLTALSNGNVAAEWRDGPALVVRIIQPDGTLVGSGETALEPDGPRALSAIAPDVNGGFMVAWRSNDVDGQRIYLQHYDSTGAAAGDPILVHGPIRPDEMPIPAITGLANGGFAVTWGQFDHSPQIIVVHSQAFGPDNLPIGPETVSDTTFDPSLYGPLSPHIVELSNGYVVTWEAGASRFGLNTSGNIGVGRMANYFQVFDNDGHALSGIVLAHVVQDQTELGTVRTPPQVVALPDGGFAMRFLDYIPGTNPDLNGVVELFDSHGNRVGNEALNSASADGVQRPATLGVLNNGDLVAGFAQDDPGSPDPIETLHVQVLHPRTSISVAQDGGPVAIPLAVTLTGVGDAEAVSRVVISGLPDGAKLTPPAGMAATFNPATHVWTLTGTISGTFSVTLKLPTGFAGSVDMLATVFAKEIGHSAQTASAPLSLEIDVPLLHGERIVISTPGNHLVDATHTVAGQPLPTDFGDVILCNRGNDTVYGLGGNDRIFGGPGNDKLYGGPGNDLLVAGTGHDRLNGGPGNDTFLFRNAKGDTHIDHFVRGTDELDFAKSVFKSAAYIHYDASTGALTFDAPGWPPPVHFATLAPHLHITTGDFMLV